MNSKVALVLLPSWGITDIPLTLSTLSSYLRKNDIEVKVFDFNIELYHLLSKWRNYWNLSKGLDVWQNKEFIYKFIEENKNIIDSLINDIVEYNPCFVSFSLFVSNRMITEIFANKLKTKLPDIKIVFGGSEIAYIERLTEYLSNNPYISFIIKGEGEEALLNVVNGDESEKIIVVNNSTTNLDMFPFLDFSDFDFEAYLEPFSFPIYSSRGCPNHCCYCTERNFIGKFRTKTGLRLFEEIKYQKEKYPFLKMFRLHESTSNGNIKELNIFCDLMIESKLDLKWAINGAVIRKEMTAEMCNKLHKAGCIFINYGLETPSHKVLDFIGKHLSKNSDFSEVIKSTHTAGIKTAVNIMFGLPSETEEDFKLQLDFLKEHHKYISVIAPSLWFCYFPKGSDGFLNPSKYNICLKHGSLYWNSLDNTNNYLVRLNRFIVYTDLMQKLGIDCVFGYPVLTNRNELIENYKKETGMNLEIKIEKNNLSLVTRKNIMIKKIRNMVSSLIYKISPYAIYGISNDKARNRILEKRINKMSK